MGALITLSRAAERLGRSPSTLREQIRRGQLRATKLGRDWLLDEAEVDRYRAASVSQGAGRPSIGRLVAALPWRSHMGGATTVNVIASAGSENDDAMLRQAAQDAIEHGAWTDAELWANVRQDGRVQAAYEVSVRVQGHLVALTFKPRNL